MLDDGVAQEADFTGPEDDGEDVLYRTALGARGCVFLQPERGCRLHGIGYKPSVCGEVPRDADEVAELLGYEMLPCHQQWTFATAEAGSCGDEGPPAPEAPEAG